MLLGYSLGAGLAHDVTCRFSREDDGTGSRRDFFVGCPGALAASQDCFVADRWFTPHFSVLARFRVGAWLADVACPVACQLFGLLVGWTLLIGLLRHPLVLFRMSGIFTGMYSVRFRRRLFLHFGMLYPGLLWMTFGLFGAGMLRRGLFRAYSLAGGPTDAGSSAFLGGGLLRIRSRRLGGRAAGGTSSSR